jgi:hypothetical protein
MLCRVGRETQAVSSSSSSSSSSLAGSHSGLLHCRTQPQRSHAQGLPAAGDAEGAAAVFAFFFGALGSQRAGSFPPP